MREWKGPMMFVGDKLYLLESDEEYEQHVRSSAPGGPGFRYYRDPAVLLEDLRELTAYKVKEMSK